MRLCSSGYSRANDGIIGGYIHIIAGDTVALVVDICILQRETWWYKWWIYTYYSGDMVAQVVDIYIL